MMRTMKPGKIIFACATALLLGASSEAIAAPNLLTYQGRLKESGALVNGSRSVDIVLCNVVSGGVDSTDCFPSGIQGVSVTDGVFRTTFTVPGSVVLTQGTWFLEVRVGGLALAPRERLTSAPYALVAGEVSAPDVKAGVLGTGVVLSPGALGTGVLAPVVTVPPQQITAGVLGTAVVHNMSAAQLTAGTFGSGVILPPGQVGAGNLGSGVTIPAGAVTGGTLGSGVAITFVGTLGSGVVLPGNIGTGVLASVVSVPPANISAGVLGTAVVHNMSANQLVAGTFGSGVLLPPGNITSGALGSGVTIPASAVTAGALGTGATIPASAVTAGTLGSGVVLAAGAPGVYTSVVNDITNFNQGNQLNFGPCVTGSTITVTGSRFDICFDGSMRTGAAGGGTNYWNVLVDGAYPAGLSSTLGVVACGAADNREVDCSGCYRGLSLTNASHTFCVTTKVGGTGSAQCIDSRCTFTVNSY